MPKTQKSELKRRIDRIVSAFEDDDRNACSKEDSHDLVKKNSDLELEVSHLRSQLAEMGETLNAIRTGDVDALVISGPDGEAVYSLAGAERPYRVMVESMGEGAVTLSRDGTILYANNSFARMLKIPLERTIGSHFDQYLRPENAREFQDTLERGATSQLEGSLTDRRGSKIPVYLSISKPDDQNTSGYFTVVVTDLTHQKNEELLISHAAELQAEIEDRKKVQAELQHTRNTQQTYFDSAPAAIFVVDFSGRVLLANSLVKSILGENLKIGSHASPKRGYEFLLPDNFPVPLSDLPYSQALAGCAVKNMELVVKRSNGTECIVLASATPLRTNYGSIWGAVTVLQDITERKKAEEALKRYKNELEDRVGERTAALTETNQALLIEIEQHKLTEKRLQKARKNLQAMAAEIVIADERSRQQLAADLHDTVIQTLGAAKLRSELLREYVAKKGIKLFSDMKDLLSQSIQESRQIMAELSPPVLNEFGFIPALEWLTEQISNQNGLEIKFRGKDVPDYLSHEVEVLLFQSTRELLMNITKHSQAQRAAVSVMDKGENIRITVKDDGVGFHGKVSFREDKGGFGLFSIRERLRHLGGQLIIESRPGRGTRVTMVSPKSIGQ